MQPQYMVMHFANHKVKGHNYGVAWKPAIAAIPLATTRNAISEAMNVLYGLRKDAKMQRLPELYIFSHLP